MDEKQEIAKCELCGESMPKGEEMFVYHGYSGNCPKPPLPRQRCLCSKLSCDCPIHAHDGIVTP